MRVLLNTVFVTSEDIYLTKDGENIVFLRGKDEVKRLPLHNLEQILCFSYVGASPALLGACAERNIAVSLYSPQGKYYCQISAECKGNVLLRRTQYRIADSPLGSRDLAEYFLTGKLYNARWVLERTARDHPMQVDAPKLKEASAAIAQDLQNLSQQTTTDGLRGVEGAAAQRYFSVFDQMILQNKDCFAFHGRSRRPPLDCTNALLSFVYTLLANDCKAALSGVGLDPYVGYLHTDRPGRASLALDLMEELRPAAADRFCITLINTRRLNEGHFDKKENGAVFLNDKGRKEVLSAWQEKKREIIKHPYLDEKLPWGLVPYVQSLLLARYLRGDLDAYPPFLWK